MLVTVCSQTILTIAGLNEQNTRERKGHESLDYRS